MIDPEDDAPPGQDDALAYWQGLAQNSSLPAPAATAAAVEAPQPVRTASDGTPLSQILADRPDVLRDFYVQYYEHNDRHSSAWADRVGGETPEDYANYWYETYGKWEHIDCERILTDRPDVLRDFYVQYYEHNDQRSSAWLNRVGGETPEAYALYWYKTYARAEGYSQEPAGPNTPSPDTPSEEDPPVHDPADDPWNHLALFPDWKPPYEGWEAPPNIWHPSPVGAEPSASLFDGSGVT